MDGDNTFKGRIKNENIWDNLEVAPTEDKRRNNHLRWFGHVWRRLINATVRRIYCLKVTGISRGRGRFKKTWLETVRNDPKAN